jgi:hypothetical protein
LRRLRQATSNSTAALVNITGQILNQTMRVRAPVRAVSTARTSSAPAVTR